MNVQMTVRGAAASHRERRGLRRAGRASAQEGLAVFTPSAAPCWRRERSGINGERWSGLVSRLTGQCDRANLDEGRRLGFGWAWSHRPDTKGKFEAYDPGACSDVLFSY